MLPMDGLGVLSHSRTAASQKNEVLNLAHASLPVQALPHASLSVQALPVQACRRCHIGVLHCPCRRACVAAPPRGNPAGSASSYLCLSCAFERLPSIGRNRSGLSCSPHAPSLPKCCGVLFRTRQRTPSQISLSVSPWCEPHACMA